MAAKKKQLHQAFNKLSLERGCSRESRLARDARLRLSSCWLREPQAQNSFDTVLCMQERKYNSMEQLVTACTYVLLLL